MCIFDISSIDGEMPDARLADARLMVRILLFPFSGKEYVFSMDQEAQADEFLFAHKVSNMNKCHASGIWRLLIRITSLISASLVSGI